MTPLVYCLQENMQPRSGDKKYTECDAEYPSLLHIMLSKKYMNPHAIYVPFNGENLPVAKSAFISCYQHYDTLYKCMLDELVGCRFKVIDWDGRSAYFVSYLGQLV